MIVFSVMKWLMMTGGLALCGASGFLKYKEMQASKKLVITKVSPKTTGNASALGSPVKKEPLEPQFLPPIES